MAPRFRVTYDTITEESAAQGDYADSGFLVPGNWHFAADDPGPHEMTLREVVSLVGRRTCEDSGRWFTTADSDINYRTGEEESRSVHPPRTVTPASYARLRRILCGH